VRSRYPSPARVDTILCSCPRGGPDRWDRVLTGMPRDGFGPRYARVSQQMSVSCCIPTYSIHSCCTRNRPRSLHHVLGVRRRRRRVRVALRRLDDELGLLPVDDGVSARTSPERGREQRTSGGGGAACASRSASPCPRLSRARTAPRADRRPSRAVPSRGCRRAP
jgi:hypothetical protein